jgi:hypothetical protein
MKKIKKYIRYLLLLLERPLSAMLLLSSLLLLLSTLILFSPRLLLLLRLLSLVLLLRERDLLLSRSTVEVSVANSRQDFLARSAENV